MNTKQWEFIGKAHKEVEAERKAFYASAGWKDLVDKWRTEQQGQVEEELWGRAHGFDETPSEHPLLSGFEEPGTIIQSSMMEEGLDHVEHVLDRIREGFEAEMKAGSIKPSKQSAILNLDEIYWDLKHSFRSGLFTHRTVGAALSFGAGVMRLAMKEPNGIFADNLKDIMLSVRRGAKEGVKESFRERDKKTRKAKGKKSQYEKSDMDENFGAVDAIMKSKAGRGRIGEALKNVYESKHLHKITFERFRRAYYKRKNGK